MPLSLPRFENPYLGQPCWRSGLVGCDVRNEAHEDPTAPTCVCDSAPRSVDGSNGSVSASAARFTSPDGIREIVCVGWSDGSGVNYEPIELDPAGARALALALLDAADTAEVAR